MRDRTAHRLGGALLGLVLALGASGCGQGEGEHAGHDAQGQVSETEHNDADVAFASDMLQHHAQALSMVDLTLERPLRPEVSRLAEDIREAQAPEIQTFTEWLTDWDEEIPETMRDHANAGHGHEEGDMAESMEGMEADMPGMMTAEEMTALESAPDAEFERMWLEMMIEHHEGAVVMAKAQQDAGQFRPAIELAEQIAESQTAEIEEMEALLTS